MSWYCELPTEYPIATKIPDLELINKKKTICNVFDLVVSASHRLKIKETKDRKIVFILN